MNSSGSGPDFSVRTTFMVAVSMTSTPLSSLAQT